MADPRPYIAPPLPHGTSNRKAAFVETTRWRSLELHKHHRALGLATAPSGTAAVPLSPSSVRSSRSRCFVRTPPRRAARFFVEKFPGRSLYAVKANPSPDLLQILWDAGVTHYDVASIGEVRLVARDAAAKRSCASCTRSRPRKRSPKPISTMACRPSASTRSTSSTRSSRDRDRRRRRDRPQPAGPPAGQLGSCQAQPRRRSSAPSPHEVKPLLFAARQASDALGICFHVGSQAMSPAAYAEAMARVRDAIVEAAVTVDIVDVGGGFPSGIRAWSRPPLETYFEVIHRRLRRAADQLFGRTVVRAGPRACAPNMPACWSASKSAAATSSTSTTAPMARCSMPRISAGAIRSS